MTIIFSSIRTTNLAKQNQASMKTCSFIRNRLFQGVTARPPSNRFPDRDYDMLIGFLVELFCHCLEVTSYKQYNEATFQKKCNEWKQLFWHDETSS